VNINGRGGAVEKIVEFSLESLPPRPVVGLILEGKHEEEPVSA